MTRVIDSISNLRYLYQRQESTGLWINTHGPYQNDRHAAQDAKFWSAHSGVALEVAAGTSADGRALIRS